MARSILRDKKYSDVTDKLAKTKNSETGAAVFPTIKALQCFAAFLGYDQQRRAKLEDRGNLENIEWHIFENTSHDFYIYLLALAESGDMNVLKYDTQNSSNALSGKDMVEVFEEYSNAGFEILRSWLNKNPTDPYGHKAILAGLQKAGYLDEEENNFDEVEF